ncbi:hypothetical protein ACFXI6_33545, partial [Streptomyces mirabilis]
PRGRDGLRGPRVTDRLRDHPGHRELSTGARRPAPPGPPDSALSGAGRPGLACVVPEAPVDSRTPPTDAAWVLPHPASATDRTTRAPATVKGVRRRRRGEAGRRVKEAMIVSLGVTCEEPVSSARRTTSASVADAGVSPKRAPVRPE